MSDYDLNDDELDTNEAEDKPKPNWRRKLEADAAKGRLAEREAQEAKRELAFFKAGLPMDDPRMTYFVKGYDGPTDPDSIRKAAEQDGFLQPAPPSPAQVEAAQHQVFTQAAAGGGNAPAMTVEDAYTAARKEADAAPDHMKAAVFAQALAKYGDLRIPMPQ